MDVVALVGLDATTYVNDEITFEVAVTGGAYDDLELLRDGEPFQALDGRQYTWDVTAVPEGSYTFVARLRRGGSVFDSAPKVVVVDRTPPTVSLLVTPGPGPLLVGSASVDLAGAASDDVMLARFELLDGVGVVVTDPDGELSLTLQPGRGVHAYRARAVDKAGNVALTAVTVVPVYVRETVTLVSEAALDGCVSVGYEPDMFERRFDVASCTWVTTWPILHFYSFDVSAYSASVVEEAVLRFRRQSVAHSLASLASVEYASALDAPPATFSYPFVSTVPEVLVDLPIAEPTSTLDVAALVQADIDAGRPRSQFRLRTQGSSPNSLGGSIFFAEVGDERAPVLELRLLVP